MKRIPLFLACMEIYQISDSGVFYRSDGCTLYRHSRHLYFPVSFAVNGLSGCMLGRCKFPNITCDKCFFIV